MFGNTSENHRNFNELMSNCCQVYWLEFSIFWPFYANWVETRLGYGEVDFQIGGLGCSGGNPPLGGFSPKLTKLRIWGEIMKKENMTDKILLSWLEKFELETAESSANKSRTEQSVAEVNESC